MEFNIRAFGRLAEEAGREFRISTPPDVSALRESLKEHHAVFREIPFRISVNHRLVDGELPLKATDDIAVLPPFSGG
ncbi:MAG: ThiS family [Bacteroidota bacterium]|jgi:molybdopterin converting factor small subunit